MVSSLCGGIELILVHFCRYEEAREEEKQRSQREDFSDMVAEVCLFIDILTYVLGFLMVHFS